MPGLSVAANSSPIVVADANSAPTTSRHTQDSDPHKAVEAADT